MEKHPHGGAPVRVCSGFWHLGAVKPADALSTSERRPLAQMPELSASSYLSGKFMSGYEDYATDQFPLREQFRTLKALMGLYVFGQKDNNGVYLADGSAAKLEYPLNEAPSPTLPTGSAISTRPSWPGPTPRSTSP